MSQHRSSFGEQFKKKFVSEPIWPEHPDIIRWVLQDIQEGE